MGLPKNNPALKFETLAAFFGGKAAAATLLSVSKHQHTYARQIALEYGYSQSMIQKQLDKFEQMGLVQFKNVGRTKLYSFDARSPICEQTSALLRQCTQMLSSSPSLKLKPLTRLTQAFRSKKELEKLFGRKVDLVNPKHLKEDFQEKVTKEKRRVTHLRSNGKTSKK